MLKTIFPLFLMFKLNGWSGAWLRVTIKKQKSFVSGGRTEITEKTSCDALDLLYL